jgi:hypothetical protein
MNLFSEPIYVLAQLTPLVPVAHPENLPILVLKVENALESLFITSPEERSRTIDKMIRQLKGMPRFVAYASSPMKFSFPVMPLPGTEEQEILRKIIEGAPPEVLKEFLVTL